jgi:branched-subunit amino acid transport protein
LRQINDTTGKVAAITQDNITKLINLFGTILQYLLGFVGIVAFAALIYGGASLVANFGNDEMIQNAKKIITNAIAGIIVALSAYALVTTVIKFG